MTSLHFQEYGKGFPVILLHGLCETHEIWNGFSSRLADLTNTKVIAVDLPGFGMSELLPGEFSIQDVGVRMNQWLASLEVGGCVLVGHSLGGYVALAMAALQQHLPRGLVLFHSTAYPDTEEKRQNRDKVIAFIRSHGVQPYVDTFVPGLFYKKDHPQTAFVHEIASKTRRETLIKYLQAMRDRPDQASRLKSFEFPLGIMAGRFDTVLPMAVLREQAELAQKPHFYLLQESGHMGMIEEPENALQALATFVKLAVA